MWVASWFSGVPSIGSRLLETPKILTHLLCHSRVCQSTLSPTQQASPSLQPILVTAQTAPRFVPSATNRPISPSWVSTIEQVLLTPISDEVQHPITGLFDSMQSLLGQLPIVAPSEDQSSVAIVEIGYDGTTLNPSSSPRFGFWQCPTSQTSAAGSFQLWVKGCQVATVRDRNAAQLLAQQFRHLLEIPNLDASQLKAAIDHHQPVAKLGDHRVFAVSNRLANRLGRSAEILAIE
ncbi:MAG TPA: hypothetical protein VL134_11325, partial [Leptolyngbya sp.]|nr:hypothetical protein [Leptolyngbya sp.]